MNRMQRNEEGKGVNMGVVCELAKGVQSGNWQKARKITSQRNGDFTYDANDHEDTRYKILYRQQILIEPLGEFAMAVVHKTTDPLVDTQHDVSQSVIVKKKTEITDGQKHGILLDRYNSTLQISRFRFVSHVTL